MDHYVIKLPNQRFRRVTEIKHFLITCSIETLLKNKATKIPSRGQQKGIKKSIYTMYSNSALQMFPVSQIDNVQKSI